GDAMGRACKAAPATGAADGGAVPAHALTFQGYATNFGPDSAAQFVLHPAVLPKVLSACAFEGDEAARKQTAGAFFDAVMGIGGSLAGERDAFIGTFATDGASFVTMAPDARVSAMTVALMLNPHFLLKK